MNVLEQVFAGLLTAALLGTVGFIVHEVVQDRDNPKESSSTSELEQPPGDEGTISSAETTATSEAPTTVPPTTLPPTTLPPVPIGVQLLADTQTYQVGGAAIWGPNEYAINGRMFSNAEAAYCDLFCGEAETSSLDFNLSRKFHTLKARLGLTDQSEAGKTAMITILGDGRTLWSKSYALGQSDDVSLDVSGVLRLHVDFVGPLGDVNPAIGEPTAY